MRQNYLHWAAGCLLILTASFFLETTTLAQDPEEPTDHSRFITDREAKGVIVFVHGLFGDANETWFNTDSKAYWPNLFDQDPDLSKDYAVYVVDYGSPKFGRASTIEELAIRIHQQLIDQEIFKRFKEVYFVTHSMGGLITKRILVELNRPKESQKLRLVRAVHFISTPAQGAELADIAEWLSSNPQVEDLKPADLNAFLQSLENQWQNLLRDRDQAGHRFPQSYCAYETQSMSGIMVVNRIYAATRCDLNPIAFDRNHSEIVKPKDRQDDTYRWTKARIQEAAKLIEVDVEATVEKVKQKYQKEMAKLQLEKQAALMTVHSLEKSLKDAIQALAQKQTKPDSPPGVSEALAKLADGDTAKAEEIFQNILASKEVKGRGALLEAAEAARHLGALAFFSNTQKALTAYRKAVSLDPENEEGWNGLGILLIRVGNLQEAEAAFRKVLELGKVHGDRQLSAQAYTNLGIVLSVRGELDEAEMMYKKSLALSQELNNKEGMAHNLSNLGNIHLARGELDMAMVAQAKSLALNRELGSKEGIALNYGNLGAIFQARGELDKAILMYKDSLALNEELGSMEGMAHNFTNLGNILLARGELEGAKTMYMGSLAVDEELGSKEGMAKNYHNLGNVLIEGGKLDQAMVMYKKSLALNEEVGSKEGMAQNYASLGVLLRTRGQPDFAEVMFQLSLTFYEELGSKEGIALNYANLGVIFQTRGALDQAEEMFQKSLKIFTKIGASSRASSVQRLLSKLKLLQSENPDTSKK